ncbi:MAG: hypothetical protein LC800_09745 [Acidobacteria bacterium]|nr:hypothetical protein [Acidobacteriota bacterium]
MRHHILARAALAALLACAPAHATRAQQHAADTPAPPRAAARVLDGLPPSDLVVYVDVRRLLENAAPQLAGPRQRASLGRFARGMAEFQRLTGIDPRSVTRLAAGGSYDPLDQNKSTGVVIVECALSTRELSSLLARGSRQAPRAARLAGREALVVSGAHLLPAPLARARSKAPAPQDVYVTQLAPGLVAFGDRASVTRSAAALDGGDTRSLGLAALPWAGRSAPLFSLLMKVPSQLHAPELPEELKGVGLEEFFQTLTSIREVQVAVGMEGGNFPFMLSVRADSAQTATKIYTAVQSLGPAVEQAQAEAETNPAARQAEELLRSLQLSVAGEYLTLSGTVKAATLRTALERASPKGMPPAAN